ncbi:MAG: twin-arginine translocation signal domain-containing protein [Chloroflexi bacterium]|nr:twin-arginine translocation signal domain-containing protein [Chloroflexota bacterium]
MEKITRRRFLVLGAAGTAALACGGVAALGMRSPEIELVESNCTKGENATGNILVTYASQCGSTGEIAETIGQVLCEAGAAVDVRPAKSVNDVGPYQAVVVGSAIQRSQWLPEAVDFVKMHQDALSQIPVAYFLACLAMTEDTDNARRSATAFLDPVRQQAPRVQPVDIGLFAGKLDFDKLPGMFQLVWPLTAGGDVGEGDYRDWETIRNWAANLHPRLVGA